MATQGFVAARLWLVRHGQTDWNLARRIQGHTPTSLNETGRGQARHLAAFFARRRVAAVWSSDLPRARETAEIIAEPLGLSVQTTPDLRERELGVFEGKTWDQIASLRKDIPGGSPASGDLADWTGVPGVETDPEVWLRVRRSLSAISREYANHDVIVVTHGGVIKHSITHVLGIPSHTPRRFPLPNGLLLVMQQRHDADGNDYFYLLSLVDLGLILENTPAADTAFTAPSA